MAVIAEFPPLASGADFVAGVEECAVVDGS
jgi:hypothetical protein